MATIISFQTFLSSLGFLCSVNGSVTWAILQILLVSVIQCSPFYVVLKVFWHMSLIRVGRALHSIKYWTFIFLLPFILTLIQDKL